MDEMKLVPVDLSHIDIIYEWANEKETRKNAFHTQKIEYSTHQQWMRNKLADPEGLFYICDIGDKHVGQIRLDISGQQGLISYSIDKTLRGKGYGKQMLYLLEYEIQNNKNCSGKVKELIARVKYGNLPSQKCFEKLGYEKRELADYIEYQKKIAKLVD